MVLGLERWREELALQHDVNQLLFTGGAAEFTWLGGAYPMLSIDCWDNLLAVAASAAAAQDSTHGQAAVSRTGLYSDRQQQRSGKPNCFLPGSSY